jgi:hypothetical protein
MKKVITAKSKRTKTIKLTKKTMRQNPMLQQKKGSQNSKSLIRVERTNKKKISQILLKIKRQSRQERTCVKC